jgi:hypothetical protein
MMAATMRPHRRPKRPACCPPRLADDVGRPSCVTPKPSTLRRFAAPPCFMRFPCVAVITMIALSLNAVDAPARLPVRRALNESRALIEQSEIVDRRRVAWVEP